MATTAIKTRIQLKNDTEAHWLLATNFVPLQGEVIIYSADDTHPFSRLKVGNGTTTVSNLPFIDAQTIDGHSLKIGTYASWRQQLTYIPKSGDILIYLDKETIIQDNQSIKIPGIKIGDGVSYGIDLPFVGDEIMAALLAHIGDTVSHITSAERTFWNNKINCDDTVTGETLILNRN